MFKFCCLFRASNLVLQKSIRGRYDILGVNITEVHENGTERNCKSHRETWNFKRCLEQFLFYFFDSNPDHEFFRSWSSIPRVQSNRNRTFRTWISELEVFHWNCSFATLVRSASLQAILPYCSHLQLKAKERYHTVATETSEKERGKENIEQCFPYPHPTQVPGLAAPDNQPAKKFGSLPPIYENITKELHFFDRANLGDESFQKEYLSAWSEANPQEVLFESTPGYLPTPLAPYRISQLLPQVKVVIVLREPVSRALSHWYAASCFMLQNYKMLWNSACFLLLIYAFSQKVQISCSGTCARHSVRGKLAESSAHPVSMLQSTRKWNFWITMDVIFKLWYVFRFVLYLGAKLKQVFCTVLFPSALVNVWDWLSTNCHETSQAGERKILFAVKYAGSRFWCMEQMFSLFLWGQLRLHGRSWDKGVVQFQRQRNWSEGGVQAVVVYCWIRLSRALRSSDFLVAAFLQTIADVHHQSGWPCRRPSSSSEWPPDVFEHKSEHIINPGNPQQAGAHSKPNLIVVNIQLLLPPPFLSSSDIRGHWLVFALRILFHRLCQAFCACPSYPSPVKRLTVGMLLQSEAFLGGYTRNHLLSKEKRQIFHAVQRLKIFYALHNANLYRLLREMGISNFSHFNFSKTQRQVNLITGSVSAADNTYRTSSSWVKLRHALREHYSHAALQVLHCLFFFPSMTPKWLC